MSFMRSSASLSFFLLLFTVSDPVSLRNMYRSPTSDPGRDPTKNEYSPSLEARGRKEEDEEEVVSAAEEDEKDSRDFKYWSSVAHNTPPPNKCRLKRLSSGRSRASDTTRKGMKRGEGECAGRAEGDRCGIECCRRSRTAPSLTGIVQKSKCSSSVTVTVPSPPSCPFTLTSGAG